MNHLGTKMIETERLILRRFTGNDAHDMYTNWACDDEVTKYLTWPPHKDTDASREYIKSVVERYSEATTYDWGIELKELKQVIGSIGVVRFDKEVECVHIGYCIGRQWWNKGVTSEALAAIIKFLMEEVKVNRIDSRHDPRNPYSGKVMEKCGLKYEGTMKESDRNNQGICDAAWYALLRKEYESR